MGLWTDIDFVTSADLITLDAEVASVAAVSGITLDDPNAGLIHRALEEAGDSLLKYQQVFGGYLSNQNVSGNHYNAVMNVGLPAINRSRILLNQVVPTSWTTLQWSAVKRWVAYWALHVFFRDAANRTLKDRYADKSTRYRKDVNTTYWDSVRAIGLPIVRQPLPMPGALYEPAVGGTWDENNVTTVAGAGTDATNAYDFAITWVDLTNYFGPYQKGNCESAPSEIVTMTLPSTGNVFNVSITSLLAPNGVQHPSTLPLAVVPYGVAKGWNVYAGKTGGPLYLQNATPLLTGITQGSAQAGAPATAVTSFTFPADPLLSGPTADTGQFPDLYFTFQNVMQRA